MNWMLKSRIMNLIATIVSIVVVFFNMWLITIGGSIRIGITVSILILGIAYLNLRFWLGREI